MSRGIAGSLYGLQGVGTENPQPAGGENGDNGQGNGNGNGGNGNGRVAFGQGRK
ncbi:hypothetical protein FRC07_012466, partial [Ceratobasidium sp. 392]